MKLQFAPYTSNKVVERFKDTENVEMDLLDEYTNEIKQLEERNTNLLELISDTITDIKEKNLQINKLNINRKNTLIESINIIINNFNNENDNIKIKNSNIILNIIKNNLELYENTDLIVKNNNRNSINTDNIFIKLLILLKSLGTSYQLLTFNNSIFPIYISKTLPNNDTYSIQYNKKEYEFIKTQVYYSQFKYSENLGTYSGTTPISMNIIRKVIYNDENKPNTDTPLITILNDNKDILVKYNIILRNYLNDKQEKTNNYNTRNFEIINEVKETHDKHTDILSEIEDNLTQMDIIYNELTEVLNKEDGEKLNLDNVFSSSNNLNSGGGLNTGNGNGNTGNGNALITSGWVKKSNGSYTNPKSGKTEFTLKGAIAVQKSFDKGEKPLEGWSINHSDVDGVYYTHLERELQKFTHKEMLKEDKSLNPSNENEKKKTGLIVGVTIGSIIFVGLVVFLVVKSKVLKKSTKKNKPKKKLK